MAVRAPGAVAARVECVAQGGEVGEGCRIIILEDQLEEALRINEQLRRVRTDPDTTADT
ncbi:hypothetical protein [Kitasatospora sp. NPDC088134]|uniref:hypothetical protein n=1 Tax=Kitasatospora sp. NPDC088134 TaxID=3364071 RepID=UPI00382E46A7